MFAERRFDLSEVGEVVDAVPVAAGCAARTSPPAEEVVDANDGSVGEGVVTEQRDACVYVVGLLVEGSDDERFEDALFFDAVGFCARSRLVEAMFVGGESFLR